MKNIQTITVFEVKKICTSKLLWIFTLLYLAMFVISAIFYQLYGSQGSVLTHANAQSFPIQHLQASLSFMAVFIAVYVGDITIQDRLNATIKLLLLRSVSRVQYYITRVLCVFIFSLMLTLMMILCAYAVGMLFFGWGDTLTFYGVVASGWQGVGITMLCGLAFAFAYFVFGLLLLIASLFFNKTSSLAMVAGASTLIGQYFILIPWIKQYTIFQQLLFFHIDWFHQTLSYNMINTTILITYVVLSVFAGCYLFQKKDLYV